MLHLKLSCSFPVSSPGCDCEAQRKGGGEDVGNASKRRDRRGLIPSSRTKNAQPRMALRDCRQYQQLNNYFWDVFPCAHFFCHGTHCLFAPPPPPNNPPTSTHQTYSTLSFGSLQPCRKTYPIFWGVLRETELPEALCINLNVCYVFEMWSREDRKYTFSTVTGQKKKRLRASERERKGERDEISRDVKQKLQKWRDPYCVTLTGLQIAH